MVADTQSSPANRLCRLTTWKPVAAGGIGAPTTLAALARLPAHHPGAISADAPSPAQAAPSTPAASTHASVRLTPERLLTSPSLPCLASTHAPGTNRPGSNHPHVHAPRPLGPDPLQRQVVGL